MSAYNKNKDPLPQDLLDNIRKTKLALKAPLETPIGEGFRSANFGMSEKEMKDCFGLYDGTVSTSFMDTKPLKNIF